ncbi:MAG: phosphatidylglycerophosphatase A [Planctomycetia bacterium]|nr:phosphatidylglycerophosphatase A [Planctomycetia bacterium]
MRLFLATGLGLGRFPFGGSLASLAACFFAVVVADTALPDRLEFAALAILGSVVCLATGGVAERALGRKDPTEVVADEFAGMWLAFAIAPPGRNLALMFAVFGLFRLFDGVKPLGLKKLQAAPGAVGILLDDLVAGAIAGGIALALSGVLAG